MDYADLINKSWDEIPEVKTLPTGSWRFKVSNASYKAPQGDSNGYVMFVYVPQEPLEDVNESDLEELGPDYDYTNNRVFARVWLETAADLDKLRKHLITHGVDLEKAGSPIKSLAAAKGREVIGYLDTRTFEDRNGDMQVENTVSKFAVAE